MENSISLIPVATTGGDSRFSLLTEADGTFLNKGTGSQGSFQTSKEFKADSAYESDASGHEGVKDAPAPGSDRSAGEQKHPGQQDSGRVKHIKAEMKGNDLRGGGHKQNLKVVTDGAQNDSSDDESDGGEKKARARVVRPNATNEKPWKRRFRR